MSGLTLRDAFRSVKSHETEVSLAFSPRFSDDEIEEYLGISQGQSIFGYACIFYNSLSQAVVVLCAYLEDLLSIERATRFMYCLRVAIMRVNRDVNEFMKWQRSSTKVVRTLSTTGHSSRAWFS